MGGAGADCLPWPQVQRAGEDCKRAQDCSPMTKSNAILDKVAQAIYNSQVESASEHVKSIKIDVRELPELFKRLKNESETAQILILSSYIDDKITYLMKNNLYYLNKEKENEIFGSNGP
jgi:hypothetical protein